jgi:ABC-type sugar transport system ATPase subunit
MGSKVETLLEARNIFKFFGGICAVNNVSFDINEAEVVGLVGDNAAGKSTLMKIISGVYHPTQGEISFNGRHVKFSSPRDARALGIEMLFQDLALVPELDVTDNLFLGKEITTKSRLFLDGKTMRNKSRQFLDELEINVSSVSEKVKNLSGGQQQSVAIARTIFFNAKLVILDEPTSAISVKETKKVLELIMQLKRRGVSVIVVSHRMEDIFTVADRIVVLRRGEKVEDVAKEKTSLEKIVMTIVGVGDSERA